MSLVFCLLREDHIIFGADSRHVIGNIDARYLNDECCKVELVLSGRGILGFAGHDVCEAIVTSLKHEGVFEADSLQLMARQIQERACEIYADRFPKASFLEQFGTGVELLLVGFEGKTAKSYLMTSPGFGLASRIYSPGYDTFEVAGKRRHGALYTFRKCAGTALTVPAGLRLAYFTLMEVSQYDTSIGGEPRIYMLRQDTQVQDYTEEMKTHQAWALDVGERIRTMIISPNLPESTQAESTRDPSTQLPSQE
jgi:hypothetical protein